MLERTRAAVFNMLGERVAGARVLDLYSGTGSLGLEALSRGAASARLVERDPESLRCLRRNVGDLGVGREAVVDAGAVARVVSSSPADSFDLVFLDPPYREVEDPRRREATLALVGEILARVLAPGGTLVFHFPAGAVAAEDFSAGRLERLREYGRNAVAILRRPTAANPNE